MLAQAVLFDFGGTLDSNGTTWLDRFYPLYSKQGIAVSKEKFAQAFYASDDGLPHKFRLADLGLKETVTLQVRCVLETLAPARADAAAPIVEAFVSESRDSFRLARPILERLQDQYSLGIVSNFYGNLESILEHEKLLDLFEVVADSGVVGHAKPAPEIFMHAIKSLNVHPDKTWMVGDSLNRDMKGAENLRMPHAWLPGKQSPKSSCCAEVKVLSSLGDLEACLQTSAMVPS